jgi:hypothetical protein
MTHDQVKMQIMTQLNMTRATMSGMQPEDELYAELSEDLKDLQEQYRMVRRRGNPPVPPTDA